MRLSVLIITALCFFSCKDPKKEIPPNVLDKEKFSDILVDFTLADSAAGINILNAGAGKTDSVYAFNPLYDNNITRENFDTTLHFYSHHPKLFKEAYELALEKLSKMQSSRK